MLKRVAAAPSDPARSEQEGKHAGLVCLHCPSASCSFLKGRETIEAWEQFLPEDLILASSAHFQIEVQVQWVTFLEHAVGHHLGIKATSVLQ